VSRVPVLAPGVAFPDSSPPRTLKSFRNGIGTPASGTRSLGDRLNSLLGARLRVLGSYSNVYGLHANFDSASTADLACHRFAFRVGPVTTKVRWNGAFLPVLGSPDPADVTCVLTLTTGLTGSGDAISTTLSLPQTNLSTSDLSADNLTWMQRDLDVTPDGFYRLEIHRTNLARMVSSSIYEIVPATLDTLSFDFVPDGPSYYQGAPITHPQFEDLMRAGDKVWRRGAQLGWWTIDLPGDERSRVSATPANLWDQTLAAPAATSPGWPVYRPYSGSLESSNVPVIFWVYADCVAGTGTITLRDQNNVTLGTINPVDTAAWYSVRCNLTDATLSFPTTKADVFFGGDGTNACKVYACGLFMDAGDDAILTSATVAPMAAPLSVMPAAVVAARMRRRAAHTAAIATTATRRPFT